MTTVLTGVGILILVLTPIRAAAELPLYAPINPNFVGGNPLMGPVLLNKAQATNEHSVDPASTVGATMNQLTDRLEHLTIPGLPGTTAPGGTPPGGSPADGSPPAAASSEARGPTISVPFNFQFQFGSGNSGVQILP